MYPLEEHPDRLAQTFRGEDYGLGELINSKKWLSTHINRMSSMGSYVDPASYAAMMRPEKGRIAFAFDVETTGLAKNRQILQLAGIPLSRDLTPIEGVKPFHLLLKPMQDIEKGAHKVLRQGGLTEEFFREHGLDIDDARKQTVKYFEELTSKHGKLEALGHNVQFDVDSLKNLLGEENMDKFFSKRQLDSMHAAAFYRGAKEADLPELSLGKGKRGSAGVAAHFDVPLSKAHDAVHDMFASVGVYRKIRTALGFAVKKADFTAAQGSFPELQRVAASELRAEAVSKMFSPTKQSAMRAAEALLIKAKTRGRTTAILAGAATFLGMSVAANTEEDVPPIHLEGLRTSRGAYDALSGINHSGQQQRDDPFGSGRNALSQFFREANLPGQPWIQASTLGFVEQEKITDRYRRNAEQVRRSSVTVGTEVHKIVQRLIRTNNKIEGIEVPVSDYLNKVYGNIDVMMEGGIPVEIKTVATLRDLRRLNRGKSSAVSQANFYAIASGAPFAYLVYTTREESDEYKIFKVPTDYGLYQADIQRLRAGVRNVPGETIRVNTPQLNATQLWNYLTGPSAGVRLFHPFRGMGGPPHNEIVGAPKLGDYGRIYAAAFRQARGGQVQHVSKNALRSKIRSQHCRLGSRQVNYGPHSIGSRGSRGVSSP